MRLAVGLDDLEGLFQRRQFCDLLAKNNPTLGIKSKLMKDEKSVRLSEPSSEATVSDVISK